MTAQKMTLIGALAAVFSIVLCPSSFAQYGGGGMGTGGAGAPGTPGYVAPSGGYKVNKALIGGLIGGGAAAGAGILYYTRHHNVYEGCVGQDGKSLIRGKDGKHFELRDAPPLPAGEKVSLKAKQDDGDASGSTLQVEKVRKDQGRCEPETTARK